MTTTNRPRPPAIGVVDAIDEDDSAHFAQETIAPDPVRQKLDDAHTTSFQAEFDPAEAEAAGAFIEDALTEADALDSAHDFAHVAAHSSPGKP
jgi:hypothetical protein